MADSKGATGNLKDGKQGKKGKKVDKCKKIPKIFYYLFLRNGLAEKGIPIQADGFVNVSDLLDVYSDFTEEDVYEVASGGDLVHHRRCPNTGSLQVKMKNSSDDAGVVAGSADGCSPHQEWETGAYQTTTEPERPGDKRVSKFLSWLLRHGAEKEGFRLQNGGFLYVDEILKMQKARGWSVDDVKRIVANNDKQRFHLEPHPETGRLRIRANQGHSMEVADLALQRIVSAEDYLVVVHGTYHKNWAAIKKQGLKRMNRTHIHFAPGEPGESGVISGMRGSCDILIYLHLAKALEDGLEFFVSANNVILSPGGADGVIKPKYFASVFQRSPRIPLL